MNASFLGNFKLFLLIILLSAVQCNSDSKSISLNKYPDSDFVKVLAYKMNGREESVIENGRLSSNVIGKGETLNFSEISELLKIYKSEDTYGGVPAKCFEPRLGFVFYDENDKIVAHSSVCFSCNLMYTSPDIGAGIFSEKGVKELGELERRIFGN